MNGDRRHIDRNEVSAGAGDRPFHIPINALLDGACVFERLAVRPGARRDHRCLAMNPAMQAVLGIPDLTGRTLRDGFPGDGEVWCDDCDRVLDTGLPVRVERELGPGGKILEVDLSRLEDGEGRRLLAIMRDVTAYRAAQIELAQREERQAFLLELSDALRPVGDAATLRRIGCELIGRRLGVARAYSVDYGAEAGYGTVADDYAEPGLPSLAGRYPFEVFRTTFERIGTGATWVVSDVRSDGGLARHARDFSAAPGVIAWINVPLLKDGLFRTSFCLVAREARNWTAQEVALAEEVADRLWGAIERAHAERTQRESDQRFRALVTAGTYSIYRMSPDWRLMYQLDSDTLASTSGPIENWVEKYILEEDRARVFAAIERAIGTGSLFELEHRVRLADGGIGWVLSRAVPLIGPDGEISEWFGAGSDITERRATVETLRASEERHRVELERRVAEATAELMAGRDLLQATMDSTADMIQVFEAVRDGAGEIVDFRWVLNNHASESQYGEVRGERLLQRNPGTVAEGIFDAFRRVTETGAPEQAEHHYVHEQFDGWFHQSVVRLNDGVATTTRDITDWKKAQAEVLRLQEEAAAAELRASEERLRQFGEASSDVLWIRDAETLRWTYLTPAFEEIYGLGREAVLTGNDFRRWAELIVPEDREQALDSIRRVREGERVTFEYRIRRPVDGTVRRVQNTDFPIRDTDGRIYAIGGVGHDVTQEREMSDRLEVLVAELQHRTRNLLGVVRSVADRTAGGSASLTEFLPAFRARLAALSRINGLLSKLEQGERVTFDAIIHAELSARGALDSLAEGQVILDGPGGVRLRSATVQTFALAIHELVTNAVKYGALSDDRGRLQVRWEVRRGEHGKEHLHVEWVESHVRDMPGPGEAPRGGGSGRTLIEQALPYQLGAETTYVFGPDGVRCTIDLPLR